MGGSAREVVLDIVSGFRCRNDSGRIYKLTSFTLGYSTRSVKLVSKTIKDKVGEHRHAVSANDANQPVARHLNSGSHCISDMKIRALCPISGSSNSRKRQEMHLISKLGTVHPLGINERFSFI